MDAVALKNQLNTHVAYMFSAVSFHAPLPQPSPPALSPVELELFITVGLLRIAVVRAPAVSFNLRR
jgi:hypothetical protein